jgi:lysophospholipase L1-like esterase
MKVEQPTRTSRGLRPKIALALLSALVSLLGIEVVLRIVQPQNLSGSFTVATPSGLVVNKSHGIARHQFGERVLHYSFHEPGLRDTPIPQAGIRILVLGDSYTYGWLLRHEDTYVGLLQRKTDDLFGEGTFVFLNAAGPGWGTGHALAYLEDLGPQVKPDIVLVFVNSGDIGRSIKRQIYTPAAGSPTELQRNVVPYSSLKKFMNAIPAYQWSLEHSHLLQLVRNAVAMPNRRPHGPRAEALVEGPGFGLPSIPRGVSITLGRLLFTRMSRWCDENGASLWVTTTGWFDASDPSNDTPTLAFIHGADGFFGGLGVPFFDLAPHVHARKQADPERYIIRDEGHPNERGAKLIADSAFEHFIEKQLTTYCGSSSRKICSVSKP